MSNTLTINGQNFIGFEEFVGAANYFYDPDDPPREGAYNFDQKVITFPGELTAAGTKRNCFGPAVIVCPKLLITHTVKASAVAAALAQLSSFNQVARFTITLPNGAARVDCKAAFTTPPEEIGWRRVGPGCFCVVISAVFMKLSTS